MKHAMNQDVEWRSSSIRSTYLRAESERLKKKLETSEQALQSYREEVARFQWCGAMMIWSCHNFGSWTFGVRRPKANQSGSRPPMETVETCRNNIWEMLAAPQIGSDAAVMEARSIMARLESDFALVRQRYRDKHPK